MTERPPELSIKRVVIFKERQIRRVENLGHPESVAVKLNRSLYIDHMQRDLTD
jgi:hypothetical protein